ncbi:MAG: hypothetical protein JWP48_3921 [Actinoallomurus sp.]|jgi:hypothetical protein|nr:hypothetical protein [Actinoallomurus sp.]
MTLLDWVARMRARRTQRRRARLPGFRGHLTDEARERCARLPGTTDGTVSEDEWRAAFTEDENADPMDRGFLPIDPSKARGYVDRSALPLRRDAARRWVRDNSAGDLPAAY